MIHQNIVKLSDFGLSRRIEEETSDASDDNEVFGVIPYMDPKKFIDRSYSLNKKSDVYSIGVLLWVISIGQYPFHGESNDVELIKKILQGRREEIIEGIPIEYSKIYTGNYNFKF